MYDNIEVIDHDDKFNYPYTTYRLDINVAQDGIQVFKYNPLRQKYVALAYASAYLNITTDVLPETQYCISLKAKNASKLDIHYTEKYIFVYDKIERRCVYYGPAEQHIMLDVTLSDEYHIIINLWRISFGFSIMRLERH